MALEDPLIDPTTLADLLLLSVAFANSGQMLLAIDQLQRQGELVQRRDAERIGPGDAPAVQLVRAFEPSARSQVSRVDGPIYPGPVERDRRASRRVR